MKYEMTDVVPMQRPTATYTWAVVGGELTNRSRGVGGDFSWPRGRRFGWGGLRWGNLRDERGLKGALRCLSCGPVFVAGASISETQVGYTKTDDEHREAGGGT